MQLLAEAGIDVLNRHKQTHSNALHVAVERNHTHIVRMLTTSGYPLNDAKIDRLTPLILSCQYEFKDELRDESIAKMLVDAGADINWVAADG